MSPARHPLCSLFAALALAVRVAGGAVDISEVTVTDVGTTEFTVVWVTSEVSLPGLDVFSDGAGANPITSGLSLRYFPIAAGNPEFGGTSAARAAGRNLRALAISRRSVAVRVGGLVPGATCFIRPRTYDGNGVDNGTAPVALRAVNLAQYSRMVVDGRLLRVRFAGLTTEGMIALVQGPAGTVPLSAIIGDSDAPDAAVVPLANLIDSASRTQAVLEAPQQISVRVLGYGAPVGSSTHTVNFGSLFNVAKLESIEASLTSPAPVFTLQPESRTIAAGASATFVVAATGTPAPTVRWQRQAVGSGVWAELANGATYGGVTTTTLQVNGATAAMSGDQFRAIATNGLVPDGISNAAVLTVTGVFAGFNPAAGAPGSSISLTGSGFGGATAVRFNGLDAESFTVVSATQVTAVVPMLGTSGFITIVTPGGTLTSASPFEIPSGPQLMNLATRAPVGVGENALLGSFTVEGTTAKPILIRALGPALTALQVSGALADPLFTVHDATGTTIASNHDWGTAATAPAVVVAATQAGAMALTDGSKDAALLQSFNPGTYTVRVTGAAGSTGVALLEIYAPDSTPRLVLLSSRAAIASGQTNTVGFVVGGAGAGGGKTVLIRAVGTPLVPALGALTNPRLAVFAGSTQIAANDDWGSNLNPTALAAATAAVGAMPLTPGDAAVLLTLQPGTYTVQVSSATGAAGFALTEVFLVDGYRAGTAAPALLAPLQDRTVPAGAAVYLSAPVVAKPSAVTYQWKKDGANLTGGTLPGQPGVLYLPSVAAADVGAYTVAISNTAGTTLTHAATLTLAGVLPGHAVAGPGYLPGGTVTINNTFSYLGVATGVDWQVVLPSGWTFAAASGAVGGGGPGVGAASLLEWHWTTVPASPFSFAYTLNVPAGQTRTQSLSALVTITQSGSSTPYTAKPDPLRVRMGTAHSADSDGDLRISLTELTRVIELYNTLSGTSRTGRYQLRADTEDGFAADPAGSSLLPLPYYHSLDTNRDARMSLFELTRVIELYNFRAGTNRTGDYHIQAGTEDGFAPGPVVP